MAYFSVQFTVMFQKAKGYFDMIEVGDSGDIHWEFHDGAEAADFVEQFSSRVDQEYLRDLARQVRDEPALNAKLQEQIRAEKARMAKPKKEASKKRS